MVYNKYDASGLSTATKPTIGNRLYAIFYETDTGNEYIWDGSAWQEYNMKYRDLGLVIDAALTAGSIIYSNYIDNTRWVRNVIVFEQSDQQYDVLFFKRDAVGNAETSGVTIATNQSAFASPNWRPHIVSSIFGTSFKFYLKNSSVSNNTYTRLRVQLQGLI